jgi:hypothetical protein
VHPACMGCDAFMNGYADPAVQATSKAMQASVV